MFHKRADRENQSVINSKDHGHGASADAWYQHESTNKKGFYKNDHFCLPHCLLEVSV